MSFLVGPMYCHVDDGVFREFYRALSAVLDRNLRIFFLDINALSHIMIKVA